MTADYYAAETENGDHMDDPSEDGLFMLMTELNRTDNTFISITPAERDAGWFVAVSLLPSGIYEVIRMAQGGKQQVLTEVSAHALAHDLTLWLAARDFPSRTVR